MDGTNANNNANSNQNAQNTTGQNNNANNSNNANSNGANNNNSVIDYSKIEAIINGRNAKTEDSILKDYFQKQGLSADEVSNAINAYKEKKQATANAQNQELSDTQAKLEKSEAKNKLSDIHLKAYDFTDELNVTNSTMKYLLKLADLSNVVDKDGNINDDSLKTALQKVINEVPGFKKQDTGTVGVQVGADTNNNQNQNNNNTFDFGFTGVRPRPKK